MVNNLIAVFMQCSKQEVDTSLKDVGNSPPQLSNTLGDEQQCKKFKMGGIDVSFPPGKLHLYLDT